MLTVGRRKELMDLGFITLVGKEVGFSTHKVRSWDLE